MNRIYYFVAIITVVLASAAATPGKEVSREQNKNLKDIEQAPIVSPN